jgi:hypothetical protein
VGARRQYRQSRDDPSVLGAMPQIVEAVARGEAVIEFVGS